MTKNKITGNKRIIKRINLNSSIRDRRTGHRRTES